jgi:hypothetical protein
MIFDKTWKNANVKGSKEISLKYDLSMCIHLYMELKVYNFHFLSKDIIRNQLIIDFIIQVKRYSG